jgi:hypothetical protein
MKKLKKVRKASWQCQDLAWKIDVGARHYATKLVLLFLAKSANDSLKTYHGYRSIAVHTGLTNEAIRKATVRLRDELGILSWESGGGSETNHYRLNLAAMTELVKQQGVFDVDSGRLLKYLETPQPSGAVPSNPEAGLTTTLPPQPRVYDPPTETADPPTHKNETLRRSNAQILQRTEGPPSVDSCENGTSSPIIDRVIETHPHPLRGPSPIAVLPNRIFTSMPQVTASEVVEKFLPRKAGMSLYNRTDGRYDLAQAWDAVAAHNATRIQTAQPNPDRSAGDRA